MIRHLTYCASSMCSLLMVACVTVPSPRGRTLPESVGNVTALNLSPAAGEHIDEVEAILKEWDEWTAREVEERMKRGEFEAAIALIEAERRARFGARILGTPEEPYLDVPLLEAEKESHWHRKSLCWKVWERFREHLSQAPRRADPFRMIALGQRANRCTLSGTTGGTAPRDIYFLVMQYGAEAEAARRRGHLATAALLDALLRTLPKNEFPQLVVSTPEPNNLLHFEGVPCQSRSLPKAAQPQEAIRVVLSRCEGNAGPLTTGTTRRKVLDSVPIHETVNRPQDCTTKPAITEQVCLARGPNGSCLNSTTVTRAPAETTCTGGPTTVQVGSKQVERMVEETVQMRQASFTLEGRAIYSSANGLVEIPLSVSRGGMTTYPVGGSVPSAESVVGQREADVFTWLYDRLKVPMLELRLKALEPALASADSSTRENALIQEAFLTGKLSPETARYFEHAWGLSEQTLRVVLFGGTVKATLSEEELARFKAEVPNLAPSEAFRQKLPKEAVDE